MKAHKLLQKVLVDIYHLTYTPYPLDLNAAERARIQDTVKMLHGDAVEYEIETDIEMHFDNPEQRDRFIEIFHRLGYLATVDDDLMATARVSIDADLCNLINTNLPLLSQNTPTTQATKLVSVFGVRNRDVLETIVDTGIVAYGPHAFAQMIEDANSRFTAVIENGKFVVSNGQQVEGFDYI